jgi:hypothetical protein
VKRTSRRWAYFLLVVLVLSPVLLYLMANAWLESAGGRQALERELARRAGLPVRLLGEFDIMLLPSLGVEGTELVIGGPGHGEEVVRSREYSVAVALSPLLKGNLQVESIHLAGGSLRVDNLPARAEPAPAGPGGPFRLPTIDKFEVSQLTIVTGGEPGQRFQVDEFRVEGFAERREAKFLAEVAGFGRVDGRLRWESERSLLNLEGSWSGAWPGDLAFEGQVDFEAGAGRVAANWPARPETRTEVLAFSAAFAVQEAHVRLQSIEATAGTQTVRGDGCLLLGVPPALRLDLTADQLDLDSLPDLPMFGMASDTDGAAGAGLQVDVRLTAAEISGGGAVARDAVVSLGAEPDCRQPD